ncbi:MAG TPA: amidohydrolase family protein [Ktedonobacterales bacterium]|jgi:imidazolonepropionase-like amidohydrolase|nr:amidohydrolase family protein [Ktedonobacterales bacterium]
MATPLPPSVQRWLIRDVRVFDGEHVLEQQTVLVEGDAISQLSGSNFPVVDAAVIDGRGRTLLPGFFDAHLHLPPDLEPALHQLVSFGVTTVLDMFSGGSLLQRVKQLETEDSMDLADVRTAGVGATAPEGALAQMSPEPLPTISTPDQADAWVAARLAEGADYIKIIYDEQRGGPLSEETVRAIVYAAHRRGALVVVHALSEQKARQAIAAGADGLAHLFLGDAASHDFGQFAAAHHVFVIPTLMILAGLSGEPQATALLADPYIGPAIPAQQHHMPLRPADPERHHVYQAATEAVRQLLQAQVPLLAGTDTAPITAAFGVGVYGATLHGELKLLVEAGMTPVQALAAATSVPARTFQFSERGLIRPGMRADLVLVDGDPTRDILATRHIVAVWKRGMPIQRNQRM